jgi:hypothetical protein
MESRLNRASTVLRIALFVFRPAFAVFITWSIVIGCIVLGVRWAVITGDWANFARLGSVIVAISILTYIGSVTKALKKLEDIAELTTDISIQVNSGDGNLSIKEKEAIHRAGDTFGRNLGRLQIQVSNLDSEENHKIIRRLALKIAILGTLIWGFGDLINLL